MMIGRRNTLSSILERGQSFVEVAIFLPIMVFLLAGVVEVSNLLITQNRVTTSARHAAGFGAAYYDPDDWPSTANSMGVVALNTVTETLDLSAGVWDIWSIRAKTNTAGDDFVFFEANHVYGSNTVVPAAEWSALEPQVKADMLSELQSTGLSSAANLEVVTSVTYHDISTILGLNLWQWTGMHRIRGLTVMRVDRPAPFIGCPILPITVRLNQPSAYPTNWTPGVPYLFETPPTPENLFPTGNGPTGFEYPNPAPTYVNKPGVISPRLDTYTYRRNVPGVSLAQAQPGYLYYAREEGGAGNFGWLSWDGSTSASDLRASLSYYPLPPGNFMELYPGSPSDMNTGDPPNSPPLGPSGDGDGKLEKGEWAEGSTGNIHSSVPELEFYVDRQIPVTVIVFDMTNGYTGSTLAYRVWNFVIVKLLGYSFQGPNSEKWISFEFVKWNTRCLEDL